MYPTKSFNAIRDAKIRAHQIFDGLNWVPSTTQTNANLTYQFFPHFHPYVPHLIQGLNNNGIAGLQASDTIYLPDTPAIPKLGSPLTVQPGTTRAILLTPVAATLANGTTQTLGVGSPLTLPDGTVLTLPNPTPVLYPDGSTDTLTNTSPLTVTLPGLIPISTASGIQWTIGGKETIIPDGTPVTLAGSVEAIFAGDGSTVTLPPNTTLSIRSGLPTPYFFDNIFSSTSYNPDPTVVTAPWPVKNLDFALGGAYSLYNWEIFFHVPLLIAVHLSQNQKFQDAQKWFHYIFNPTDNSDGPTPQRFWKVKPFQFTDTESIENILVNLSVGADPELYNQTVSCINQWKNNPFQPWAVAQFRPTAYMLKTVMAYLDNLIAWGDSLFQQYTIETINEATQLYVLAANILGPKPQAVPNQGTVKPLTFGQLRGMKLDAFSNTLAEIESDIPFDSAPLPTPSSSPSGAQILPSIGQNLYFCIPQNDQLLGYWDTVASRLFNIHNSLNLQGVYQQLPLYDPPIDPALLVRAEADGLDVSAIVSGLNQPLPLVRFRLLISKAVEICQEVKSLGGSMLAAMEKGDNEAMALLRAQHESAVLNLAQMVKYSQWQDAIKAKQGVEQTFNNTVQRYTYYQQLLGRKPADITKSIPQLADLDTDGLQAFNFSQADETGEPKLQIDPIIVDTAQNATQVSDGEKVTISSKEVEELKKMGLSKDAQQAASVLEGMAATLALIPEFKIHFQFMGVGVTTDFGGRELNAMNSALASVSRIVSEQYSFDATKAGKLGSYDRRQNEWIYQSNLAKGEINQVFKQWRGTQIREAIAAQEYKNHLKQIDQAKDIETFLQGQKLAGFPVKETTVDFYSWMKRETKTLYTNVFQLAFEVAKKAERALQNELGDASRTYIQYSYLDGTEGLLAGERLMFDLKTMEMAYNDLNQREYELTKHVSLLQVAPLALVQLRATGTCLVNLPEELFDLDCPGHYFRRVKSVALSIPCVTGPYTSVNCNLSLQKSSIRTKTDPGAGANGYARTSANDSRFNDYFGAMQAIVTSSGQSDSGLFETNLNDERYLPFEAVGVAGSQWQLTLPSDVPQFDHDTITDVILHIRYTSREGGDSLKAAALANLKAAIGNAQTVGSARLFSLRHEFPTDWARFKNASIGGAAPAAQLSFSLTPQHFPFWAPQFKLSTGLRSVEFIADVGASGPINIYSNAAGTAASLLTPLNLDPSLGLLRGALPKTAPLPGIANSSTTAVPAPYNLYFDNNTMSDLWMLVLWPGPPA